MKAPRPKPPTTEQRKRREEVNRRNTAIQTHGIPFPKRTGGVFGGKPVEKKS